MKLKTKILTVSSLVALAASPLALAGKSAGGAAVAPEVTVEVSPDSKDVDSTVVEDDTAVEPGDATLYCETGDCEAGHEGSPLCDKGSAHCEDPEDCEIPIEWLIRGGGDLENPDIILYNMAARGVGAPATAKDEVVLGQDDKAAVLAGKGAATPQILREKKGPVALVNKGRVFLR